MSYTYATYTAALAELMVMPSTDPNFVAIEPSIIDYAEQRIYRELDLLGTNITDSTATLTASNRNFTLPSGLPARHRRPEGGLTHTAHPKEDGPRDCA